MKNLFYEVDSLDQNAYETYQLSEEILMEHAANGMALMIKQITPSVQSILIVCGSGNNGADGITLARLLQGFCDVRLYLHKHPKTPIGVRQLERIKALGIVPVTSLENADVIVDALFGSGLKGELKQEDAQILETLNCLKGHKIACDIPSGLNKYGHLDPHTFVADVTLTMGGLKRGLYADKAKDYVGEIQQIDLGLSREKYEADTPWKLLEASDIQPPHRLHANTHKGSYGHLCVIHGQKEGAAIIAGLAALHYGSGLVSMVGETINHLPAALMQDEALPENATAIACGMGLGRNFQRERLSHVLSKDIPLILDADIFYHSIFYDLLHKKIIITPHPKEFVHILKTLKLADITVQELQNNRFEYVEQFSRTFPNVTLILKGANTIIAADQRYFINPLGDAKLAKGGSGDVLSGICGALLAQGYTCLDAAVQASLAQTLAAKQSNKNSYALLPEDIIQGLAYL